MTSLLRSFIDKIEHLAIPELSNWLVDGLVKYHDPNSLSVGRSEDSFEGAEISFGRSGGYSSPINDLVQTFGALNDSSQLKFHRALTAAIDGLSLHNERQVQVLHDLVQVSLDTKNGDVIRAIKNKLKVPNVEFQRSLCFDAIDFLEEGQNQPAMLELAKFILENLDFPFEVSAHLLVGLCRLDIDNAPSYAVQIEPKLSRQLAVLRAYPQQFEKFSADFCRAIVLAARPIVIERLLSMRVYAELLLPHIVLINPQQLDGVRLTQVRLGTRVTSDLVRQWQVDWNKLCFVSRKALVPSCPTPAVRTTLVILESLPEAA